MPYYLPHDNILELNQAILDADMNTPSIRDYLLQNIRRGYVAGLPSRDSDYLQIVSDLSKLNGLPFLLDDESNTYEVPLRIWLLNAISYLRAEFKPEKRVFQKAFEKVAAKSEEFITADQGIAPAPVPDAVEKIVHEDDLLTYGWLRRAISVGDSIARLTVTRYQGRRPQTIPGKGEPMVYHGTGWLIGRQYIITNHHVINARSEAEPYADEVSLHVQAQNTKVEFGFDNKDTGGEVVEVESLEAWWPWKDDPRLDYAILKLRTPSNRESLTLSPRALDQLSEFLMMPDLNNPAVNIVQHPRGGAKMLGIRNNLVNNITNNKVVYFTDTERGSSGSPVCDDNWEVVALHRGVGTIGKNIDFQGKATSYANNGVRIDLIINDLQERYPDLWSAINAKVIPI